MLKQFLLNVSESRVINLAVRGRIARVTVVCQCVCLCVCLLPGQLALNCFNLANMALVATKL